MFFAFVCVFVFVFCFVLFCIVFSFRFVLFCFLIFGKKIGFMKKDGYHTYTVGSKFKAPIFLAKGQEQMSLGLTPNFGSLLNNHTEDILVRMQDEWDPNPVCFFVIKVQDICLHLEKTFIYPKIFCGKILGRSNRIYDSC